MPMMQMRKFSFTTDIDTFTWVGADSFACASDGNVKVCSFSDCEKQFLYSLVKCFFAFASPLHVRNAFLLLLKESWNILLFFFPPNLNILLLLEGWQ